MQFILHFNQWGEGQTILGQFVIHLRICLDLRFTPLVKANTRHIKGLNL